MSTVNVLSHCALQHVATCSVNVRTFYACTNFTCGIGVIAFTWKKNSARVPYSGDRPSGGDIDLDRELGQDLVLGNVLVRKSIARLD